MNYLLSSAFVYIPFSLATHTLLFIQPYSTATGSSSFFWKFNWTELVHKLFRLNIKMRQLLLFARVSSFEFLIKTGWDFRCRCHTVINVVVPLDADLRTSSLFSWGKSINYANYNKVLANIKKGACLTIKIFNKKRIQQGNWNRVENCLTHKR